MGPPLRCGVVYHVLLLRTECLMAPEQRSGVGSRIEFLVLLDKKLHGRGDSERLRARFNHVGHVGH